jgi:tol-pal system protein YbgF
LLVGACVTSGDIDGLHRQMNDIEKEIQTLDKKSSSKEEVSRLNTNVSQQTEQLLKSNADTGLRLNELTAKMERLEAAPGPGGPPPADVPADTAVVRAPSPLHPPPAELYNTAYADYNKGRYPLAIQGFQEYLAAYPGTDLSDNAQYWIGECFYAQRKYPEAIAAFDKLLKVWPKSDKAAAGLLKKAYALAESGQKAEAVVQLQYVIHEYPTAEETRLARAKLKSMGVEAR